MDSRFFANCQICRKRKFYISKREIKVPQMKEPITSMKLMCGRCKNNVIKALVKL